MVAGWTYKCPGVYDSEGPWQIPPLPSPTLCVKTESLHPPNMGEPSRMKTLPSKRWTSFDGWDYNGMKERLERSLAELNKDVLLHHAELIKGQKLSMSDPFSAGQFWICFEMVAEDGSLVIARVRLPRHPDTVPTVSEEDEFYAIACEVSTMRFVAQNLPSVAVPEVYAYEGPASQLAIAAGAIYMLLEGLRGNTLQDVAPDLCSTPVRGRQSSLVFLPPVVLYPSLSIQGKASDIYNCTCAY